MVWVGFGGFFPGFCWLLGNFFMASDWLVFFLAGLFLVGNYVFGGKIVLAGKKLVGNFKFRMQIITNFVDYFPI